MKKLVYVVATVMSILMFFCISENINAETFGSEVPIEALDTQHVTPDEKAMLETANILEKYFGYNEYGRIVLKATKEELVNNLGLSEKDAQDLIDISDSGVIKNKSRGFVGIYIYLGPKVRKMNGWIAGTFAGGYVGWYLKELAASSPIGAGVAAVIAGGVGLGVKYAVEHGLRVVPLGRYIPNFKLSYNVYVP